MTNPLFLKQFQATYGKPLLAARDSKCSVKDAEAGALAMEALHKQVMPFLLRRTKDEVLSDLPEKIIQDRNCDLSPVQLKREISSMVKVNEDKREGPKASSHVFQALQCLLKLCSHLLLVLGESIPESLLPHLTELFPASAEGPISVGQHPVLIFAQHKALLDIIERDLFHTHMKSWWAWFESDISRYPGFYGAWLESHARSPGNGQVGQRKVVNVHRLIMRGTLEEKVMSLQKFKVSIANAIINADNANGKKGTRKSVRLDENSEGDKKSPGGGKGLKAILGGLEELWDQSQYTEEYNLSQFLAKLNG
ncbi:unnamed protein product [Fraxinus pennsylvanica]|uniref:SNF2 N-terminal domain-containing protein n=1 Tax=Fraxinus pennsylvanica TaxID=56036 RepID=A0AAD2EAE2_9LAMI|nr:unnamed protein product [Fraxinus pennsylvanica]